MPLEVVLPEKIRITFCPRLAICASTCAFAPFPMPTIAMTAATPMMIPSAVSTERILFRRSARRAMFNVDPTFMIQRANRSARFFPQLRVRQTMGAIEQRQLYVLARRCARQQIKALKNKTEFVVANVGQLISIQHRNIGIVQKVAPGSWPIEAAKNVHERRFAGTARAHKCEEFAALNLERNTADGMHFNVAGAIRFVDVGQLDDFTVLHVGVGGSAAPQVPVRLGPMLNISGFAAWLNIEQGTARSTLRRFGFIGYGNLRCCPLNGFAGGELDPAGDVSSAVTTRSPSFKPSVTSVIIPSLIPVLIWTGFGLP